MIILPVVMQQGTLIARWSRHKRGGPKREFYGWEWGKENCFDTSYQQYNSFSVFYGFLKWVSKKLFLIKLGILWQFVDIFYCKIKFSKCFMKNLGKFIK